MSKIGDIYYLEERHSDGKFTYIFLSEGTNTIIKAIQYKFVTVAGGSENHPMFGRDIYNLGFGDYDLEQDTISDLEISNNGDHYKVFNTVLSTIPGFFASNHGKVLMVNGSDSRPGFEEECRQLCKKRCKDFCRNHNRRINIYKNYVDKNYDSLIIDYQFFGGIRNNPQHIIVEAYEKAKKYDSVFLVKK